MRGDIQLGGGLLPPFGYAPAISAALMHFNLMIKTTSVKDIIDSYLVYIGLFLIALY